MRNILTKSDIRICKRDKKLKCLDFYITATDKMLKCLPYDHVLFHGIRFLDSKLTLCDETRSVIKDLTDIAKYFNNFDVTALNGEHYHQHLMVRIKIFWLN